MTVNKLETLADLIAEAERRYDKVAEESGFKADYYLGRLRGLQDASRCERLTPAEQAVIEAALEARLGIEAAGEIDSDLRDLGVALQALRKERGI